MGIQIKGSNDTISASDGSMVLEGATLTFTNENITGISTMASAQVTGTTTLDDDLKVGISTLFVDVSTGRVGINTISPQSVLQVNDNNPVIAQIWRKNGGTDDQARIALGALSTNVPTQRGITLVAENNGAGHDFIVNTSNSHGLGPTEKLRVTSAGSVGINQDNPNALLSLGAGVNAIKLLLYDNEDNNKYGFGIQANELRQFFPSDSRMVIGTIATSDGSTFSEKLRIRADGRVAIASSLAVTGVCTAADYHYATHPGITTMTGNASTNTLTISSGHSINSVLVFQNGICLTPGGDYTISGTTLTFASVPVLNAEVVVRYLPK